MILRCISAGIVLGCMLSPQVDDDWQTVIWQKIDLMGNMGLRPWYTPKCGTGCFEALPTTPITCNGRTGSRYAFSSDPLCRCTRARTYG